MCVAVGESSCLQVGRYSKCLAADEQPAFDVRDESAPELQSGGAADGTT